jgi:hypothetical protein
VCHNECKVLGPNAGACLDQTEEFSCILVNGVCTRIEKMCGNGVCEKGEVEECFAPDCGSLCPKDCS